MLRNNWGALTHSRLSLIEEHTCKFHLWGGPQSIDKVTKISPLSHQWFGLPEPFVCACVCAWERERQTDRQTDQLTDRKRERETESVHVWIKTNLIFELFLLLDLECSCINKCEDVFLQAKWEQTRKEMLKVDMEQQTTDWAYTTTPKET